MHRVLLLAFDRLRLPGPSITILLLSAMLWMLNHPYAGFLNHDAKIYALLALHWLDPAAYSRDPFFMFGSQDNFTLFSPAYGSLIRLCGLSKAAWVTTALAGLLWLMACWWLACRAFDGLWPRAYVMLCMAIYSLNYSPDHATYVLNENFCTPRIFAIPIAVMSIASSMDCKWALAAFLALLSLAIHPLYGIWAAVVIACFLLDDKALLAMFIGTAFMLIGASLMPGFAMFHLMDPDWFYTVKNSTKDVLVGTYGEVRLNMVLFWISALMLGSRFGSPGMRRWYEVTALVSSYGFLLAQLCSYFYPIEFVLQAQTWRVMWLAIYLGVFALVDVLRHSGNRSLRSVGVSIVAILLSYPDQSGSLLFLGWLLLRGNPLAIICHPVSGILATHGRYVDALAAGLLVILAPTYWRELAIEGNSLMVTWLPEIPYLKALLIVGGLGVGPVVWCAMVARRTIRHVITVALIPGFALAAAHWDHRTGELSRWENRVSTSFGESVSEYPIAKGDVVFWPGNSHRVYFELDTASYASSFQAIGILYSKKKAEELTARLKRVAIASVADEWPLTPSLQEALLMRYERTRGENLNRTLGNLHDYEPEKLTGFGLQYVCEDLALDWVVSSGHPIDSSRAIPVVAVDKFSREKVYFYRCVSGRTQSDHPV